MPSSPEHTSRVARLQQVLRERSFEGALLLHAVDIYYLSGTRQVGS